MMIPTGDAGVNPITIGEFTWDIGDLASSYPCVWTNDNKQLIADLVGDDKETLGTITASRWILPDNATPPSMVLQCGNVRLEDGYFNYATHSPDEPTTGWYMNFADPYLFGYGEGPLLAQDELQIVEHPILCSLGKAIEAGIHGVRRLTRSVVSQTTGSATPVLVQGAPRRCILDTSELYGDNFARAPKVKVQAAVHVLHPVTLTNILALAAMLPRSGSYTSDQINEIFATAYTGFRAIVLRSPEHRATLHTGHWGCGVFGGNKGLMASIQILAAGTAGVEQLVYWCGSTTLDRTAVEHGLQVADLLHCRQKEEAMQFLNSSGYRWGDANENYVPYCPPSSDVTQGND
jgi:hypothetical protein